jgi:hypothetical protein
MATKCSCSFLVAPEVRCVAPVWEPQTQYGLCEAHFILLRFRNKCVVCRTPKENKDMAMCPTCFTQKQTARSLTFRAESANKRQAAIDAGLCTNWKTCTNKARHQGQMCDACYASYKEYKGFVKVAPAEASIVKAPATTPVAPATTPVGHLFVTPPLPSLEDAVKKAQTQLDSKEAPQAGEKQVSKSWADLSEEDDEVAAAK